MSGRFVQLPITFSEHMPWLHLAEAFTHLRACYNLAPGQMAGVLIKPRTEIQIALLQWGLLPFWAKEINLASHTFNARLDTVNNKPSFRAAFKTRHAVIPMAGYYEWQNTPQGKQAYYFQAEKNNEMLWAAGLWEPRHAIQTDTSSGTFTIITQTAEAMPTQRMPMLMDINDVSTWLDLKPGPSMPFLLTRSTPNLKMYPVSKRINATRDDDADLIAPIIIV
jgi:putative SOS response-associated peptidase YedK